MITFVFVNLFITVIMEGFSTSSEVEEGNQVREESPRSLPQRTLTGEGTPRRTRTTGRRG
jgi:hypothetical protein